MNNLILPGRGKVMMDGWETRRSRTPNHSDWVTIKLGATGYLDKAEIDTYQFKGNFPEAATLQACYSLEENPDDDPDCFWFQILAKTRLEADRVHFVTLNLANQPFTHVKLTIYPDGGVKRLRVYGRHCTDQEIKIRLPVGASTKSPSQSANHQPPKAPVTKPRETPTNGHNAVAATTNGSGNVEMVLTTTEFSIERTMVNNGDQATTTTTTTQSSTSHGKKARARAREEDDHHNNNDQDEAESPRSSTHSATGSLKRPKKSKQRSRNGSLSKTQ